MSRLDELDKFLKFYAKVMEQSPKFNITYSTIYDDLTNYDIDYEDRNIALYDEFDVWRDRYINSKYQNLNVYWDERQKRFLQFVNYKGNYKKSFKLYVSLPKDKICEGVNYIFDFINRNNIETYSKVADYVRADDIVIRLSNKKDLKSVMEYINNSPFLRENSHKTNPFLMRNGIVGFSYDDTESYNLSVAKILNRYFSNIREQKNFSNCNLINFKDFLEDFYEKTFITKDNLSDFNLSSTSSYSGYKDDSEKLLVFKQIIEFLKFATKGDFDYENYCYFIGNCRDMNNNRLIRNAFKKNLVYDSLDIDEAKDLFFESCVCTCNKYDRKQLVHALKLANEGKYDGFTNDNGYRSRMNSSISKLYLKNLCFYFVGDENENLTDDELFNKFAKYIEDFINSVKKKKN